jgi:hypothetical protein
LVCQKENSLQSELGIGTLEEILEREAEAIKDQGLVATFYPKPVNRSYTSTTSKALVNIDFILKLGIIRIERFKFDSDFPL